MDAESSLLVGRCTAGYLVRLVGRGTLRESAVFRTFADQCKNYGAGLIVVDLSRCDYLDSTFMGCLLGVHKACASGSLKLQIVASPSARVQLFSTTLLDRVLDFADSVPDWEVDLVPLEVRPLDQCDLGRHVMQCHRRLAEMGGQEAGRFQSVADRLAAELGDEPPAGKRPAGERSPDRQPP